MIEGGFPFPAVIMVAGGAGTGKTTFALKYLSEGARRGEQGLYFTTLSEPTQWMLRYASQFNFINPDAFGDKIVYTDLGSMIRTSNRRELLNVMEEKIAEVMPQRIVIDPISVIGGMIKGKLSGLPRRHGQPSEELERHHRGHRRGEPRGTLPY